MSPLREWEIRSSILTEVPTRLSTGLPTRVLMETPTRVPTGNDLDSTPTSKGYDCCSTRVPNKGFGRRGVEEIRV